MESVIESKNKPSLLAGKSVQFAFGFHPSNDRIYFDLLLDPVKSAEVFPDSAILHSQKIVKESLHSD